MRLRECLCISVIFCFLNGYGKEKAKSLISSSKLKADSTAVDSLKKDLVVQRNIVGEQKFFLNNAGSLNPANLKYFPGSSLQQYLKGGAAGVYVQEPSGEPGTEQNMFIHGSALPLLSVKEAFQTQPLVVIDGVPVISKDHPFAYDIQSHEYARIGTATNVLSSLQPENVESIQVLTDPVEVAKYGALASNGVIYVKTKQSSAQRRVTVNSYVGMAQAPNVTTINGATERAFRMPFYNKYGTSQDFQNIPAYLTDSLYNIYYGPSNWTDLYYKNSLVYGFDASATGGNDRSNFRASVGNQRNGGVADDTRLDRYSAAFLVNMIPLKWLNVTASINASQVIRGRNKYMRDRFAEARYFPNLTNPPAPNKDYFAQFQSQYDKSFDKNRNNMVNGFANLNVTLGNFWAKTQMGVDYNEGYRDFFFPSTLMETNSYVSNYFGYNQRLSVENSLGYNLKPGKNSRLDLELGQNLLWDTYFYSYGNAYRGSNDYIKVNLLSDPLGNYAIYIFSNQLPTTGNGAFLNTLTFRYLDRLKTSFASFYGKASYSYKDKYFLSVLLREDGASTSQPTDRWFFSPTIAARWDVKKDLLNNNEKISGLNVNLGYSRLGKTQADDRFAAGPQYSVDLGYSGEKRIGTFSGVSTLNRPYSTGWIGYNIPWAYSEQITAGATLGLLKDRVSASIQLYSRSDKDQLLPISAYSEYGYDFAFQSGMNVNNKGLDVAISASPLKPGSKLKWTSTLNFNFNRNELTALPGGRSELSIGNRLLRVGSPIDSYWLYYNEGIYNTESEIPVNPATGRKLSIDGIELSKGDPKWKDLNGDYILDGNDKVLRGHTLPVLAGGFSNAFSYKKLDFSFNLYFNLGRDIMNEEMSRRFDFVNNQSVNNITSVKEVTFWEKRGDYSKYPLYNPWSSVVPYRMDQDLFLENASFIKLRSVTLGYDFTSFLKKSASGKGTNLKGYVTANNLFTITNYSGRDPELVSYNGYDTGYGITIPRTFTVGFKFTL